MILDALWHFEAEQRQQSVPGRQCCAAQNATDLVLHHMQAACDSAAAAAVAAEASGVSERGLPLQLAAGNMLAAA